MTRYHITPDGPGECGADPSNPNSTGCKYQDDGHYDSQAEAETVHKFIMMKEGRGATQTLNKSTKVRQDTESIDSNDYNLEQNTDVVAFRMALSRRNSDLDHRNDHIENDDTYNRLAKIVYSHMQAGKPIDDHVFQLNAAELQKIVDGKNKITNEYLENQERIFSLKEQIARNNKRDPNNENVYAVYALEELDEDDYSKFKSSDFIPIRDKFICSDAFRGDKLSKVEAYGMVMHDMKEHDDDLGENDSLGRHFIDIECMGAFKDSATREEYYEEFTVSINDTGSACIKDVEEREYQIPEFAVEKILNRLNVRVIN